jgi:hypothetical protein
MQNRVEDEGAEKKFCLCVNKTMERMSEVLQEGAGLLELQAYVALFIIRLRTEYLQTESSDGTHITQTNTMHLV